MGSQGDAPEGYCPGVPVRADDQPCWDGKPGQSCFQCLSPFYRASACSGVMETPPPKPVICKDDSDCARIGTVCEPSHPLANEQGCRGPRCDEGGECPEGMVCDPDSPLADPAFLATQPEAAPVVGCRPVLCNEADGPSCAAPVTC